MVKAYTINAHEVWRATNHLAVIRDMPWVSNCNYYCRFCMLAQLRDNHTPILWLDFY